MAYNTILPGAWELTKEIEHTIYALRVPTPFYQVAQTLANDAQRGGHRRYRSVPVRSLDPLIAASFPQIIQTARSAWLGDSKPWLFATEKLPDLSLLSLFVKAWLKEEFSCIKDVDSRVDKLKDDSWSWDENPITYPNPYDIDTRYSVLPDYLAKLFLENQPIPFRWHYDKKSNEFQEKELTFYRVVRLQQGAELMSWPPTNTSCGSKEAPVSFVIKFQLQTVPWRKEPIISHQLSLRRWLTKTVKYVPYKGMNVYIGDNRRWLNGKEQPFSFIPLKMKWNNESLQWHKVIQELSYFNDSRLPEPNELKLNPQYKSNDSQTGIQTAIAYHSQYDRKSLCKAGVGTIDLASLDEAIKERLPLRRVGEGVKVSTTFKSLWKLEKKKRDQSTERRGNGNRRKEEKKGPKSPEESDTPMVRPTIAQQAFRECKNTPDTILILYDTQSCRDKLIQEMGNLLSWSPQGEPTEYTTPGGGTGEEQIYQGDFGSLCIKTQHVGDTTNQLDLNSNNNRVAAINERVNNIRQFVPEVPQDKLWGALVEIPPKNKKKPNQDPKLALRIGLMKAGYANQHLYGLEDGKKKDNDTHLVQRAILDLFRQFGVLPKPKEEIDGIDPHIWLTCFYVIRRTKKTTSNNQSLTVVLMVRVHPITAKVEVTLSSGCKEKITWLSYPKALKHLLNERWDPDSVADEIAPEGDEETNSNEKQKEQNACNQFVTECLRDCLYTPIDKENQPRVLFMVSAQNARKLLPWLQNPNVPNDFPNFMQNIPKSKRNRLWLVRVRDNTNDEVPVNRVQTKEVKNFGGRTSGVFCWENICDNEEKEIFLSLREGLDTEQNLLRTSESRLENGSKEAGSRPILEIAILHNPEIEAERLACFVHSLRKRWPYFSSYVSLPFPFPFAKKAKEYAVSAQDEPEDEPEDEPNEPVQLTLFD